ncbi:MAG: hypothetical protein ACYDH9_22095 [Limisphaerales bacterium]
MAENTPNSPAGAVPPRPAEAAKVQPKKETVRINLPPKPTAAPTIKLPAPPATAGAAPGAAAPVAFGAGSAAPHAAAAPSAAAPLATGKAAPAGPPRAQGASRPTAAPTIGMMDKALAMVAALIGVVVLVRVILLSQ